ncbi:MAG: hypothetical protein QXP80_03935 [Zestosphaera sp.]
MVFVNPSELEAMSHRRSALSYLKGRTSGEALPLQKRLYGLTSSTP